MDATERLRAVLSSDSAVALGDALTDPSPDIVRAAIRRLADVEGRDAAEALRRRMLTADLSVVEDIAKALRQLEDTRAVPVAIAGLAERRYTVRLAAALALGVLADRRGVAPLCRTLQDGVSGVRAAALAALARLGPEADTAEACATLLSDPEAHVRIAAVRAIARTSTHPGPILAGAVADPDPFVRLELAAHVAGMPHRAAAALLTDPELRVRKAAAGSAGLRELGLLAELLRADPRPAVRSAAARTLGSLGDARVADLLIPGLEDCDAIVRATCLRALERLVKRGGTVRRLCRELRSDRPERRRASVYALARLEPVEAACDVSQLANDPDPDVRLALIHSAHSVLASPEPLVRYLSGDDDAAVRSSAENWLVRHAKPTEF